MASLEPCPGCGVLVPPAPGVPAHPYIGASPGCWALYLDVLAREYGEFSYPPVHRLTVDAYAAQHPGAPSRRSIRSVAVHLIGLYHVFERKATPEAASLAVRRAASGAFEWLDPPPPAPLTVLHVRDAGDLEDHTRRVQAWGGAVWDAWRRHHETIRRWAERLLREE